MQTPSFDLRHNQAEANAATAASQYLTFIMNNEEYGVDILCVQEIRGWETATPLPNAPKHIKGVINLRGTIVPIIDLRQCFGLSAIDRIVFFRCSEHNCSDCSKSSSRNWQPHHRNCGGWRL